MKQNFASIPTKYNGIQFRSRLEARWAAFFDLLKWEWEYEPIDLNGWIPDFRIKGNNDLLVEIKYFPVYNSYPEMDERWIQQIKKIEKANPETEILLLSNSPVGNNSNSMEGCLGFILEKFNDDWWSEDLTEQVLIWGSPCFIESVYPTRHTPKYTVKGESDAMFSQIPKDMLTTYWNEAGNITQWKGQHGK